MSLSPARIVLVCLGALLVVIGVIATLVVEGQGLHAVAILVVAGGAALVLFPLIQKGRASLERYSDSFKQK